MKKHEKTKVILVLFILALIFTLPLFFQVLRGADIVYHLNRIRALSEAMSQGDFFPKIYFHQNFGYGYGSPLFYPDLFLWIPALFHCLGVPILRCYQIFVLVCTFLTALTSYYFLSSLTCNKKILFFGVALYLFNPYRISTVYIAATMGEMLATIFLPLLCKAIYDMFYQNKNSWILLSLAFAGVVLSHNITFLLSCLLLFLTLVINIKGIIKKPQLLLMLLKAALLALGLTAFFLFPMLEQMRASNLRVFEATQKLSLTQKALTGTDVVFNYSSQVPLYQIMVLNSGWILMGLSGIALWKNKDRKNASSSFCFMITLVGWLFLWMSTQYFPWELFKFFNVIQFPYRFMILVSICFLFPSLSVILSCNKNMQYCLVTVFLVSSFLIFLPQWTGSYQTLSTSIKDEDYSIDKLVTNFEDNFQYNASELAMGEYLPNRDFDYRFTQRKIQTSMDLKTEIAFVNEYNNFEFNVSQVPAQTTFILPITYYKGYEIICTSNNDKKTIHPYADSEYSMIMFQLPEDFSGTLQCQYKGTKLQFVSSILSLSSVVGLIFLILKGAKRNEKTF